MSNMSKAQALVDLLNTATKKCQDALKGAKPDISAFDSYLAAAGDLSGILKGEIKDDTDVEEEIEQTEPEPQEVKVKPETPNQRAMAIPPRDTIKQKIVETTSLPQTGPAPEYSSLNRLRNTLGNKNANGSQ